MRFVHLAPEDRVRSIRRAGITGAPFSVSVEGGRMDLGSAVFAMPVVADYGTTFQWTRELRRVHGSRMVAVHFRVPDAELVHVGRYGLPHRAMHASASATWVEANPRGAEVIVPRRIEAREVVAIRGLNQRVGWTDSPEPSGLSCVCPACLRRGDPKFMRRVRAAMDRANDAVREATDDDALVHAISAFDGPLERAASRVDTTPIIRFASHPSARVRARVTWLLGYLREDRHAYETLFSMLDDDAPDVRAGAVESLTRVAKLTTVAKAMRDANALVFLANFDLIRCSDDLVTALEVLAEREDSFVRTAVRERSKQATEDTEDAGLKARLSRLMRIGASGEGAD